MNRQNGKRFAPAVYRILKEHGFTYKRKKADWELTNPNALFLRNLGKDVPHPEVLIMTAFGLPQPAANWRLHELPLELEVWKQLDPDLYNFVEKLPQRAGWRNLRIVDMEEITNATMRSRIASER